MISDISKQVIEQLSKALNILILVPKAADADALGAGLALRTFLQKLEKEAVVLSPTPPNTQFEFLPGFSKMENRLTLSKSFVIDINTKKTEVAELSYRKEPEKLSIFIQPKTGFFNTEDVSFRHSKFPTDLIVTISLPALDQLGEFYAKNTDLFFETPIVNIDYRPDNENYAQTNLINLAATSASEVVLDLINQYESSLIDEDIATNLLAGIVAATNSFQHVRTTPATFLKASQLVNLGGRQQEIVTHLYKNRSLGLLKLWGRVLARLKQDQGLRLSYSIVGEQDVQKAGAALEDVDNIIKEMIGQLGMAKHFLFLRELNVNQTQVYSASANLDLSSIFAPFRPIVITSGIVKFVLDDNLAVSEQKIVNLFKQEIQKIQA